MARAACERIWRTTAMVMCAAVPVSFYVLGDLTDAFPGVLTLTREEEGPTSGPRAVSEDWKRIPVPDAVPGVPPASAPAEAESLQERMEAKATLPVVDGGLAFSVVDAETGEVLAARDAESAHVPASTLKLLTAAAVLRQYSGDEVLVTRATLDGDTITLVGGGDMTLSEKDVKKLASQAATLAKDADLTTVQVRYDDSYLTGGANPAWGDNGPAGGWVAPTASLALDSGRLDAEPYGRKSLDPARDAAERFAELVAAEDLEVAGDVTKGEAPQDAPSVEVASEPLSELVRHTLLVSDNTTAELLAHLVALARDEPTTPEGAAAAVEAEIRELGAELGVDQTSLDTLEIHDGSGLSRSNRVPPALLSAVLAQVASGSAPVLEQILYDVPIAGLSGTLADRFDRGDTSDADGLVRGKTGYLGGAATLAGVAVLPDGRTVGYSIVVHGFDGADADDARAAVDAVAAELVQVD